MPEVASPGSSVGLSSLLTNSFGSVPSGYSDFWVAYYSVSQIQAFNFSFWYPSSPLASTWFVNGVDIGGLETNQTHVSSNAFDTTVLKAGNSVGAYAYVTVPVSSNN